MFKLDETIQFKKDLKPGNYIIVYNDFIQYGFKFLSLGQIFKVYSNEPGVVVAHDVNTCEMKRLSIEHLSYCKLYKSIGQDAIEAAKQIGIIYGKMKNNDNPFSYSNSPILWSAWNDGYREAKSKP